MVRRPIVSMYMCLYVCELTHGPCRHTCPVRHFLTEGEHVHFLSFVSCLTPVLPAGLLLPPDFPSCYKLITEVNQNVLKRRRKDKSKKMRHPRERDIFYSSTTLAILSLKKIHYLILVPRGAGDE